MNKLGFRNRLELLKIASSIFTAKTALARTMLENGISYDSIKTISLPVIYEDVYNLMRVEKKDTIEQIIEALDSGHSALRQSIRDATK